MNQNMEQIMIDLDILSMGTRILETLLPGWLLMENPEEVVDELGSDVARAREALQAALMKRGIVLG